MKGGIIVFGLVSVYLCPVNILKQGTETTSAQRPQAPDPTLLPCWTDELYPSGINNESQTYIIPMTLDGFSQTAKARTCTNVKGQK